MYACTYVWTSPRTFIDWGLQQHITNFPTAEYMNGTKKRYRSQEWVHQLELVRLVLIVRALLLKTQE